MSGKRARLLRKKGKFSKKTAAMCLGLCIGSTTMAAEGDVLVSIFPHFSKPFGTSNQIQTGTGAGVKLTYRPLDFLNVFAQGDYLSLSLPGIDPINMVGGSVGAGYHLGLTDRISLDFNLSVGGYSAKAAKTLNGIDAGATITFTYRFNPVISADVNTSATHYAAGTKPFMAVNAAVSPGITFNITEAFSKKSNISVENNSLSPVFPVLYSWYESNDFGSLTVTNNEDTEITDVTVSFYQPQYMAHPKECASFSKMKKGENQTVNLYAFFNEQMLELTEKTNTQATVTVSYSRLGQKKTESFPFVVPVYGRNNMTWDDDRRAAVFVSSKDPAAMLFGKYVTSVVRDNVRSGVPVNIQYAMGIFETLDQFGLSYVIDPTSAFADNVGTSTIDFLQFPYQTLMYRGGDCDDLSILVCSLFEAVGIKTAFITIPGHIFMAFDSGLTVQQAYDTFSSLNEFIIDEEYDQVWVPLEITLTDEGFNKAWRLGAREWNTAAEQGVADLYAMEDSWLIYPPVSVPGATAYFTMPDRQIVSKLFDHSVDQWISREIEPQIKYYEAKLAVKDDANTRNKLGILYGKYGLFVQADEQFKMARRTGYVPSILNTGNIYYSKQDYDRARKWYKSVLKDEPENQLALLGIARCAYELADYQECDAAYARVMQLNPQLAAEYAYLGSFVNTTGRAFSLADRLQNTIWSEEKEEIPVEVKNVVENKDDDKVVLTEQPAEDKTLADLLSFDAAAYAIMPQSESDSEEDEDLEAYDISSGDGNPPKKPSEQALEVPELEEDPEMEKETEVYQESEKTPVAESFAGLSSEIALQGESAFALDLEALIAAAPETDEQFELPAAVEDENTVIADAVLLVKNINLIEENESDEELDDELDDEEIANEEFDNEFNLSDQFETAVALDTENKVEDSSIKESNVIVQMEVPRFTEQPSSEWAPEEAYSAAVIPGMKSFQEEMGEYQNEKSFLYEETEALAMDPEDDLNENKIKADSKQLAMAGTPDVNPFSSYLSSSEAKKVEQITQFKLDSYVKEIEKENSKVEAKPVVAAVEKTEPKVEAKPVVEKIELKIEEKPAVVEAAKIETKVKEEPVAVAAVIAEEKTEEKAVVVEVAKAEDKVEAKPAVQTVAKIEDKAEEKPVVAAVEKTEPKVEEKAVEPMVELKVEEKPAVVEAAKIETKVKEEPVAVAAVMTEEKTEEKPVVVEIAKTEAKVEAKPAVQTVTKIEDKAEEKPATVTAPKTEVQKIQASIEEPEPTKTSSKLPAWLAAIASVLAGGGSGAVIISKRSIKKRKDEGGK